MEGSSPGRWPRGFESGLAILEWLALDLVIGWAGTSIARVGAANGRGVEGVWHPPSGERPLSLNDMSTAGHKANLGGRRKAVFSVAYSAVGRNSFSTATKSTSASRRAMSE